MATLGERLEKHVADLRAERRRIRDQADADVAAVDAKLTALLEARGVVTQDIETHFTRLRAMGLLKEL